MKNSLLLALLWAICFIAASAQRTLPPSLRPHAANWHYTAVKALHQAGYDMPTLHNGSVSQRSNGLQLDSTKTFYGYGLPTPADSTPLFLSTYRYPQADTKVETNFQYENGVRQKVNRSTSTSDQQGRLTEVFAEIFDPAANGYRQDSRLDIFPHGTSQTLVDSFFVWQWDTTAMEWALLIANKNTYDAQDRLLHGLSIVDVFGQSVTFGDSYTYDSKGDNNLIESYALIDGIEYPSGKTELTYADHLLTQSIVFEIDDNGKYLPQSKSEYSYTPFRREEVGKTYQWSFDKNDWVQSGEYLHTYDAAQRLTLRENHIMYQNAPEDRERFVYQYKEGNLLALEEAHFWDGNVFYLSDRKHYYYSGGSSASREPELRAQPLLMQPNPTTGMLRLNLQESANIQIFSNTGQQIRADFFEPQGTLNISDLPSGLYFVVARTETGVFTGRVVKE